MTRSELVERLVIKNPTWHFNKTDHNVREILEHITHSLGMGKRVEIRGFGSFSLHYRPSRVGRNPKTGENVTLSAKYVPHFKAGKTLRERVDIVL